MIVQDNVSNTCILEKYEKLEKPLIQKPEKYMGLVPLDDTTSLLKFRRVIEKPERHDQSFSNMWYLFRITSFKKNKVFCRLGDQFIHIYSPGFFFIPAFTHAEWHFQPGVYEYEGYVSYLNVHDGLPQHPIFFHYEKHNELKNYSNVVDLLKAQQHSDISSRKKKSYVAEKTKLFLDNYFCETLSFDTIAKEVKLPRSTMTREFKNYYGVTPVAYRNILRTWEAMRLIRNQTPILKAATEAGFTSMTQYNQHFHRIFDAPPSSFF